MALWIPAAGKAAGLQGPVTLQVYYPDLGAPSLRNALTAIIGPGLEFGTVAGGTPAPGTFIVNAGVDVASDRISFAYHDSGTFIQAPFNGYVMRFPGLAGGAIYSVTPRGGSTLGAPVSYTRDSVRINVSALRYGPRSTIDLDVRVAAPSYVTPTGVKPLISTELISGSVTFSNSVYLSGTYANNLTGQATSTPAAAEDDIVRKAREIRDFYRQREAVFNKAADFAGQQIGAGGAQPTTAKGVAYGIVVDQLIDQTQKTTPFDERVYQALSSVGASAGSYATWMYATATAAISKGAAAISGITARRWDEVIPKDPNGPQQRKVQATTLEADEGGDFTAMLTRSRALDSTIAARAGQRYEVVDQYIESYASAVQDMQLAAESIHLAQAALNAGDRASVALQMRAASSFLTGSELSFIDAAGYVDAAHSVLGITPSSLGNPRVVIAGQFYLNSVGLASEVREALKAGGFTDAEIDRALASALALNSDDEVRYAASTYVDALHDTMALGRPSAMISAVPEPASVGMLALGLFVLGAHCRRRARKVG